MQNHKRLIPLLIAVSLLSFQQAQGTVSLQFNGSAAPPTIIVDLSTTKTVTLTLRLVATNSEQTTSLDYFLFRTAGPAGSNPFSLTGRDLTGSDYPDPSATNTQVTSSSDVNNATGATGADGRPDNLLAPNNEWDLGANTASGFFTGGTHLVATLTLTIAPGATLGTYTIMTGETIAGAGWNDASFAPHAFDSHAAINITLVPEPSTWMLLGLGAIGLLWLGLRQKRQA